jgi:integrase
MTMRKARPRQTALPPDLWPPADREAWKVATAKGSVLRGGGLASHVASRTIEDLTRRYAYFLGFALSTKRMVENGPPAASVAKKTVDTYIAELQGYASSVTVAGSVRKVLRVASCIAPGRDWEWLRERCKRLEAAARPVNKRPRVVEVDRLSELGHRLMDEAERSRDRPPFTRALLCRNGLLVALLAASLLRLGNLSSLRLGKTLLNTGGQWSIAIPAEQSKNRRPIELPLPKALGMRIERYLSHHRRRFRGCDIFEELWLSRNGRPLSASQLYNVIVGRTEAAFGTPVNPHLFRDCAATSIAVHHGAHVGIAAGALGHIDPRTTEQYYNQAGMIEAVRSYQTQVLGCDENASAPCQPGERR